MVWNEGGMECMKIALVMNSHCVNNFCCLLIIIHKLKSTELF